MAAYFPNLQKDNITLYTIPVFWVISLYPRFWAASEYQKRTKAEADRRQPREFVKAIEENPNLDPTTRGRLRRAEAAVLNGFENFGPFAAAVTAGSAAHLDPAILNGTVIAYLVSRVVYAYIYIKNETDGQAKTRGAAYIGGLGLLFSLFIQAGNKWKNAAP